MRRKGRCEENHTVLLGHRVRDSPDPRFTPTPIQGRGVDVSKQEAPPELHWECRFIEVWDGALVHKGTIRQEVGEMHVVIATCVLE